eukprot:15718-Eustigmatos_ZCMA.PRE.1
MRTSSHGCRAMQLVCRRKYAFTDISFSSPVHPLIYILFHVLPPGCVCRDERPRRRWHDAVNVRRAVGGAARRDAEASDASVSGCDN